jgi:hypothetical protein
VLGGCFERRSGACAVALAVGRDELGPDDFEAEVAAGRSLDLDSAIAEALATKPSEAPPTFAARASNP